MKKLQVIVLCLFFGFLYPITYAVHGLVVSSFLQNEIQSETFEEISDNNRDPNDAFIITIKTDNPGSSGDDQFTLPWIGTYDVDWGDGISDTGLVDTQTHTYASVGTYDVAVTATTGRISFSNIGDKDKLLDIQQWGTCAWTEMNTAFYGCNSLTVVSASDTPILSSVSSLYFAFSECSSLTSMDVSTWDVGNVSTMEFAFRNSPITTLDVSNWNTQSLTNAAYIFQNAIFSPDVSNWNMSNVTTIRDMLRNTNLFDRSLANWDISNITNMSGLLVSAPGLSTANYDATLISWAAQTPQSNIIVDFGNSQYSCDAEAARDTLINIYGWTINDGGNESPNILTYDGNNNDSGNTPIDVNDYRCTDIATILGNTGNLSKPCFIFNGWNTSADGSGTTYLEGDGFNISSPTTLYAQWIYDSSCESVMVTQYYNKNIHDKWIEIKNISNTIIPENSLYIVTLRNKDADDPEYANPTLESSPSFNSFTLITKSLAVGEVLRYGDPEATLPAYACPGEIGYDELPTYKLHTNAFNGDDLVLISGTNNSTTWENRIDVVGNGTRWGTKIVFIRNDCTENGPSKTFNLDDWTELTNDDLPNTVIGSNFYLGEHFSGGTNFVGDGGDGIYNGWTNGLPERSRSVTVTADYDTGLKGSFDACTITTASDKIINVRADDYITIVNDLTVNARGVLNIDHEGSLIMFNDLGTITNDGDINVYRSTSTMEQYDYHYWSSPIDYSTNTTPVASVLTDFFASRIYKYNTIAFNDLDNDNFDDEQNDWVNYSSDMKSGTGYAAMTSSPGERNTIFSGKVNNGVISVNVALSNDENGDEDGDEDDWNLLGNPYPSAISADEFITQNSTINGTLYFWTHVDDISIDNPGPDTYNYSTDDYAMYSLAGGVKSESNSAVPTGIIETGLGFFVDAISPGPVEFNNSMRSKSYANNNSFSASSTNEIIEKDRFWLNLTNPNGAFSQILIGFFENATLEKDRLYDGVRLKGSNYIDFYSLDNTSYEYGIQGRPAFDENESIVLGYQSNILGNLSIDLGDREGVLSETPIYITDHYLSITHDLTIAPYSFNTEVGTFNDRFEIAFNEESLSTNDIQVDTKTLQITELQNGQVQIKVPSQFEMASIQIMDISGKVIYNFSTQGYSQTFSLNNLSKTAYLVTVELNNGQTITKKAIKRK